MERNVMLLVLFFFKKYNRLFKSLFENEWGKKNNQFFVWSVYDWEGV